MDQVPVWVIRILLLLLWRWNSLDHPTRTPHSNRIRRNILSHSRSGTNRASLANPNTRKNQHISTNPAIIFNKDRVAEFDIFPAGQNTGIVSSSENADSGCNLHSISNNNQTGIQNSHTGQGQPTVRSSHFCRIQTSS